MNSSLLLRVCFTVAMIGLFGTGRLVSAANFIVTTNVDENDGIGVNGVSLREAIDAANANPGPDTIDATGIASPLNILADTHGPFAPITDDVDIQGPGPGILSLSPASDSRHFFITNDAVVSISGMTLTDGFIEGGNGGGRTDNGGAGGGGAGLGGAIFINSGTVTLSNLRIFNNGVSGGFGGGQSFQASLNGGGGGGFDGAVGQNGLDGSAGGDGGPLGTEGAGGNGGINPNPGDPGGFGGGGGGGSFSGASGMGGFGGGGGGEGFDGNQMMGASGGSFGGAGGSSFQKGGGGGAGLGGGIFIRNGSLSLMNNSFEDNFAFVGIGLDGGTDGEAKGGGIFVQPGAIITNLGGNTFSGNVADSALGVPGDDNDVFGTTTVPVELSEFLID